MKPRLALAAALCLLATHPALGQSKVYGNGAASCGLFVAAAQASTAGNKTVDSYMMWLAGYASMASAQTGVDYFNGTTTKAMQDWLEAYCLEHPQLAFDQAALQLMVVLKGHQGS